VGSPPRHQLEQWIYLCRIELHNRICGWRNIVDPVIHGFVLDE
jgi:hypothetical protein